MREMETNPQTLETRNRSLERYTSGGSRRQGQMRPGQFVLPMGPENGASNRSVPAINSAMFSPQCCVFRTWRDVIPAPLESRRAVSDISESGRSYCRSMCIFTCQRTISADWQSSRGNSSQVVLLVLVVSAKSATELRQSFGESVLLGLLPAGAGQPSGPLSSRLQKSSHSLVNRSSPLFWNR